MTTTYDDGGARPAAPQRFRAEHRDGLGIGEPSPRLSWQLPAGAARQTAYELRVDDGTVQRVEGDGLRARPLARATADLRRTA